MLWLYEQSCPTVCISSVLHLYFFLCQVYYIYYVCFRYHSSHPSKHSKSPNLKPSVVRFMCDLFYHHIFKRSLSASCLSLFSLLHNPFFICCAIFGPLVVEILKWPLLPNATSNLETPSIVKCEALKMIVLLKVLIPLGTSYHNHYCCVDFLLSDAVLVEHLFPLVWPLILGACSLVRLC